MCFTLALASVINFDRKWRYDLECHSPTMLAVSITIVIWPQEKKHCTNTCHNMC